MDSNFDPDQYLKEKLGSKDADPLNFSDRYNTPIPADKQSAWNDFAKKNPKAANDRYDYDAQGAWLANQIAKPGEHGPDTFKKPNHPTFSDLSQYNGVDDYRGGRWDEANGKYIASPTNVKFHSPEGLKRYFSKTEKDVTLELPDELFDPDQYLAEKTGESPSPDAHKDFLERQNKGGQFPEDKGLQSVYQPLAAAAYGGLQAVGQIPGGIADAAIRAFPPIQAAAMISPKFDQALNRTTDPLQDLTPGAFRAAGLDPSNPEAPQMKHPMAAAAGEIGANLAPMLMGKPGQPIKNLANEGAGALKESAITDVEKALGATTNKMKEKSAKVAPELLNRPVSETFAFTKKGLADKTTKARESAGEAIESFGKLKGEANPKDIVQSLEKLKDPYIVEGKVIDQGAIDNIEAIQDTFRQYGDSIQKEGLRKIRRTFDKQIYSGNRTLGKTLNEGTILDIKNAASDDIREALAKTDPDLAKLNKKFNFWANLNDVAEATSNRTRGQQGALPAVAQVAGAATAATVGGAVGKAYALKTAMEVIKSTGWRLAKAHVKNKLADAIAFNNPRKISDALSLIPGVNVNQLRRELNQPPIDIKAGDHLSANIDGKTFKVRFVQKLDDKYKVKTSDGKIKVISPDDAGIAPTEEPISDENGE